MVVMDSVAVAAAAAADSARAWYDQALSQHHSHHHHHQHHPSNHPGAAASAAVTPHSASEDLSESYLKGQNAAYFSQAAYSSMNHSKFDRVIKIKEKS